MDKQPPVLVAPACRMRERSRICEVPSSKGYIFDTRPAGHADAITSKQIVGVADVTGLCVVIAIQREPGRSARRSNGTRSAEIFPLSQRILQPMDQLSGYAHRPFPFVLRYLRKRLASH